ncbi:MAG: cupin domain-containing protein [Candidatus Woesearchaeota archaeon]|jgi:mannose-1-phosphate guanylyltransferase/mannose-6-phosphate isomerase|nr:cupin domain-containing protein [Candidatus Woesearchaeota archaeon]MDP7324228.1 cupin domain-containing protein [Candidatus Woesearchaeota archaeon]MDP7457567.1 cupin domain-containing protein [Candidatus Woesearchaeota archaeon]|tara:strand:+ start:193 stop:552 length:360 start_codon:yes stop_codon:yes gene_type:complete
MTKLPNPKKIIEEKPWGKFEQFLFSELGTLKILYIKDGEHISKQKHKTRDEFWKIIDGSAEVELDDAKIEAQKDDEFFIPKGMSHRASALNGHVTILAISYGHFDPDDKERVDDKYGRK